MSNSCSRVHWLIAAALFLIVSTNANGQGGGLNRQPAIILGPSVQISTDRPAAPHVESFLAISPKDSNRMLASSISYEKGKSIAVVYLSLDGGSSWKRVTEFGPNVPQFGGHDPIVYFDSTGRGLFSAISPTRIWGSSDGGLHWNSVTNIAGGNYDRQYLGIDTTSGPYAGRIYFAGAVRVRPSSGRPYGAMGFTYSSDHGTTWAPPTIVDVGFSDGRPGNFGGAGDILISSQGKLVIPFQASVDLKPTPPRAWWLFVSENGGQTFEKRQGLPFDDGPASVRRQIAAFVIHAAIDRTRGPFADRIYVAWIDFANDRYDVKVAHSDDLGLSWSVPVKVNDNTGPGDPSNVGIAVNNDGVVSLIWNDRRDDPTNMCFRVYTTASLDGGDTFLRNIPFSSHPTCPNTAANWTGSATIFSDGNSVVMSSTSDRFMNGGETQGLVASPDGKFHATWNNDVNGVMHLWYTTFTIDLAGQKVGLTRLDRTKDVRFESSAPVIDFASKTIEFTLIVRNSSPSYLAAPLTLVLDRIESDFGGLIVVNADNGLQGTGAAWKLLGTREGLAPSKQSDSRAIRFQFDGNVPEPKHLLRQFVMHFKVFSEPNKQK